MIRQSSMWSGHAFRFLPLGSCRYSVLTTPPWAFDFPLGHPPGESEFTKDTWGRFACTYNIYIYIFYIYPSIYLCIYTLYGKCWGFSAWFLLVSLELDDYDLVIVLEQMLKFTCLNTMLQGFYSARDFHSNDPQWRQSTLGVVAWVPG